MSKQPWDPENSGYGKHPYRKIDPATVNPEDYAINLRGEERHYGDVREYNTANNEKHPENNLDLYDLGLIGTKFSTEAVGYEGDWIVVDLPKVSAGGLKVVARQGGEKKEIPTVVLGVTVNQENLYELVKSKLLKRGMIDREQRKSLKTGIKSRQSLRNSAAVQS